MTGKDNKSTTKVATKKKSNFFKGLAREFKIIKWPTKEEAKKAFAIVAAFTIAYIILVGVFDFAFQKLFEFILSFR